jgi:peptide chain release factor 2
MPETIFEPEKLKNKVDELQQKLNQPNIWNDPIEGQLVSQDLHENQELLQLYNDWNSRIEEIEILLEMGIEENDTSVEAEIETSIKSLKKELDQWEFQKMLGGEYDKSDAIITVNAGAGGTDAQDWAEILLRMYLRWSEQNKYKVLIIDQSDGEEAGIKSATCKVSGRYAYGYLKAEKGVHRLVRLSPFNANNKRQTSFASVEVSPIIPDIDSKIEINPDDLDISTMRAGGAGGQHVNKVESAVRITHIPSGLTVKCQQERSQTQNRELALELLKSKLLERKQQEHEQKLSALKGDVMDVNFGSQIRSYVFHPYSMVKDHRTSYETGNVDGVLNGDIDPFIEAFLRSDYNMIAK